MTRTPAGRPLAPPLLALVLLATPLASAAADAPPALATAEAHLAEEMQRMRLPGLGVAIVRGDEALLVRGYGVADAAGRPFTAQTPYLVASVTKPLTSLLVMQLVEEGRVELDAPVQRYLPAFAVADAEHGAAITIRHLLSHTSGLPSMVPGEYDRVLDAPPTAEDVAREIALLRDVALGSEPGARFQYSNVGFVVLAGVIEAVTGLPYEDVIEERLYARAGMGHSHARREDAMRDGLATGYRYWFGMPYPFSWSHSRAGTGAGFTYSSAEDLGRLAQLLLNEGSLEGERVLRNASVREMFRPQTSTALDAYSSHYGLGWFAGTIGAQRVLHHSGVGPNVRAEVVLAPEADLAVVVLMNSNDAVRPARFDTLAPALMSILLGEPLPVSRSGDMLRSVRDLALGAIVVLPAATALSAWLARRGRRGAMGRVLLALPAAIIGALWALLCLVLAPSFWPLRGLILEAPEVGYAVVLSGAIGALCAIAGPIAAARAGRGASG